MASQSSAGGGNHLSFAKIAAMPPPSNPHIDTASHEHNLSQASDDLKSPLVSHSSSTTLPSQAASIDNQEDAPAVSSTIMEGLNNRVQGLVLSEQREREGSESSGDGRENGTLQREASFDDDRTHLSNSSTKPTSFDSKSMASVTTFAMDEKDSLRPDDSASVQAADEEESLSGPASGAPNSLTGSEAGARGFRDSFREANAQRIRGLMPPAVHRFPDGDIRVTGAIPPDSVSNNFVVANPDDFETAKPLHGFPSDPDEKLLEAMNSPKDRLLLLQLEEKIRNFIQDSKEQSLELPPSNAFGRLLAHKLGDYYHLTHFVDNNVTSVRLHRTPFCRLPTPLSHLRPVISNNTPPPNAPAMKIMRRNGQNGDRPSAAGSTAASSSAPSKAASETCDEGGNDDDHATSSAGATPVKDRAAMTREEREAKYQEARERIFRDFSEPKPLDTPSGDSSTDMSRSSSTSGRRKNFRQKTPHDDSFEARSQFNAYYPGMPYTAGSVPVQMPMHNGTCSNQQPYMVGPGASPPTTNYPPSPQSSTMYPAMNPVPQYTVNMTPHIGQTNSWQSPIPQQSSFPGYATLNQPSSVMGQQAQTRSSPATQNYAVPNSTPFPPTASPSWGGQHYSSSFSQSPQRNISMNWPNYSPPSATSMSTPYPYGQLPNQHHPMSAQGPLAHPIPGSYNRSAFNPQTRSFVPGGNVASTRYPGNSNPQGTAVYGGPQPTGLHQWSGYLESNGQAASHINPLLNTGVPNSAVGQSVHTTRMPSSGNYNSIAKWGTPAHLPPKPPPSEVSSEFEVKGRVPQPSAPSFAYNLPPNPNNGPLVVSGGTSLSKPT